MDPTMETGMGQVKDPCFPLGHLLLNFGGCTSRKHCSWCFTGQVENQKGIDLYED